MPVALLVPGSRPPWPASMITTPLVLRGVTVGFSGIVVRRCGRICSRSDDETRMTPPDSVTVPTVPTGLPLTKNRPSVWVKTITVLAAFFMETKVVSRRSIRKPSCRASWSMVIVSWPTTTFGVGRWGPWQPAMPSVRHVSATNMRVFIVI